MPVLAGSSSTTTSTSASVFFESTSELATVRNVFSVDGVATDPTTVTLTVTSPSGTATSYTWPTPSTLDVNGTGAFSKDIACSEDGEWQYVWTSTGTASDATAGTWTVFETDLGRLYPTVAALKSRLKIAATDTQDDYELHSACFAASRSIEQYTERIFYRSATGTARTFEPCGLYQLKLGPYNDLVSLTSLKTDPSGAGVFSTTWSAADYQLQPVNPAAAPETRPYTKIKAVGSLTFPAPTGYGRDDRAQVTGVFGWPSVPWAVKKAALMLAEEIHKSTPYGVAGIADYGVIRVRENPRIKALIDPYVHPEAKMKAA